MSENGIYPYLLNYVEQFSFKSPSILNSLKSSFALSWSSITFLEKTGN